MLAEMVDMEETEADMNEWYGGVETTSQLVESGKKSILPVFLASRSYLAGICRGAST